MIILKTKQNEIIEMFDTVKEFKLFIKNEMIQKSKKDKEINTLLDNYKYFGEIIEKFLKDEFLSIEMY